jgi:N-acetylmuramoyl-L-alanine amidase
MSNTHKALFKALFIALAISLSSGMLLFLFYNQWITIALAIPGNTAQAAMPSATASLKKKVSLWYWHKQQLKEEKRELFWTFDPLANGSLLIRSWLTLLEEEGLVKNCSLQSLASSTAQELLISFDHSPFRAEHWAQASIGEKWMLIESLLMTIRTAELPAIQAVRLLVDHQPLHDEHLDFSVPWPCTGFRSPAIPVSDIGKPAQHTPFRIMIHPAGDAQHTGRVVHTTFERAWTLQLATALKQSLESACPGVQVTLTRSAGDSIDPLQLASFVNRLQPELYLSLHIFPATNHETSCALYYYTADPTTDHWHKIPTALHWLPYQRAHIPNLMLTRYLAQRLATQLIEQGYNPSLIGPYGIPCRSLQGILPPAIACEIGLIDTETLSPLQEVLTKFLVHLIREYTARKNG